MGIEAMFKDCPKGLASRRKSGGYNLEECQSTNQRLLSLILLTDVKQKLSYEDEQKAFGTI
jgi:hypothetical protein